MKKYFVFLIMFYISNCLTSEKFQKVSVLNIERVIAFYSDPEYISNITVLVGRLGRMSNYKVNYSAQIIRPWYNNVSITMTSFEFKDNQYKQSFIGMTDKFCDILQKPLIWFMIPALQKYGNVPVKCPMVGHIYGNNFEFGKLPDNFPSSKWRLNFSVVHVPLNKLFLGYSVSFSFQEYKIRNKVKEIKGLRH